MILKDIFAKFRKWYFKKLFSRKKPPLHMNMIDVLKTIINNFIHISNYSCLMITRHQRLINKFYLA